MISVVASDIALMISLSKTWSGKLMSKEYSIMAAIYILVTKICCISEAKKASLPSTRAAPIVARLLIINSSKGGIVSNER